MPISQADAHTLIEAAQAHAQTLGITVTVAVVDAGGLVKAMDRMDGAPPLSAQIAEAKAQAPRSGTATVMSWGRWRRSAPPSSPPSAR